MTTLQDTMTSDHRRCDEFYAQAERALEAGDWAGASAAFDQFEKAVRAHFDAEEQHLFPAFEEDTGMRMGPTEVMRGEHKQMRALFDAARAALAERDADEFSGNGETLLIMIQQHNVKEENVLYPMCDQHLGGQRTALLASLQQKIAG